MLALSHSLFLALCHSHTYSVPDIPTVLFGYATTVIPRIYTYYVSTALFAIFGVRMLREGLRMSPDEGQEELEEVQAEIKKKDEEVRSLPLSAATSRPTSFDNLPLFQPLSHFF